MLVILLLGITLTGVGHFHGTEEHRNSFLNLDNLIDGIATPMSVYAIMAVGQTLVIITGGIDISVGSIFALSALGAAAVLQRMGADASPWKAIGMAMLVAPGIGLICGLINGVLITGLRLHPFIVTLGTLGIFRSITNSSTAIKTLPYAGMDLPDAFSTDLFQRYFFKDADGTGGYQLMPMLVMLAVVVAGWFYLRWLVAGREAYAVGGNEEAARYSGLNVNRTKMKVYALCGLTAGIAGIVSLGRFGTISTNTGTGYELNVVAAAVVGRGELVGRKRNSAGRVARRAGDSCDRKRDLQSAALEPGIQPGNYRRGDCGGRGD